MESRVLITSGPTREYLDPVRYLTNASSGRMGRALAEAVIRSGRQATIVTGPVELSYPAEAEVIEVVGTEEMLDACRDVFPRCDGLFGVAAACDYRPQYVSEQKIKKTGRPLLVEMVETSDVMAALAAGKTSQWLVGFALETEDAHFRAMTKLQKKNCDLIVLNGPEAMHASDTRIEVLDPSGQIALRFSGAKEEAADRIMRLVDQRFPREVSDD
ncbi:MAG: phosphopantothenoylcysteine decarboxylase [Planctomycetales bacterium]